MTIASSVVSDRQQFKKVHIQGICARIPSTSCREAGAIMAKIMFLLLAVCGIAMGAQGVQLLMFTFKTVFLHSALILDL